MSFAEEIKQAEAQAQKEGIAQGGGDWYKFVEGDNIFRILAKPTIFFEKFKVGICYTDCGYQGSARFLTWVMDMKDEGRIKLAKLPYGIGKNIAELEQDEDYSFDSFPMPYNIKVRAKNAGTKEVEYTLIASPKRGDVEPWVLEELRKKTSPEQVIEKMKEKQIEKHKQDGTWQANQDRKAKLHADLETIREHGGLPSEGSNGGIEYPKDDINIDDIPF